MEIIPVGKASASEGIIFPVLDEIQLSLLHTLKSLGILLSQGLITGERGALIAKTTNKPNPNNHSFI